MTANVCVLLCNLSPLCSPMANIIVADNDNDIDEKA